MSAPRVADGGPRGRGYAWVGISAVVAGVAGYVVLLLAARSLGSAEYAHFAVFWGVCYTAVGFLFGVQQETTRMTSVARAGGLQAGPRLVVVAAVAGVAVAAVAAATSPVWGASTLPGQFPLALLLVIVASFGAAGQFTVTGAFGGAGAWRAYAAVATLEVLSRVALVAIAAVLLPQTIWFAAGTAVAFTVWLFVVMGRRSRMLAVRSDSGAAMTALRVAQTMLAAGASGFLINGFPVIVTTVASLVTPTEPSRLGVLILLVTVLRAPLMLPLLAFTSALVARFTVVSPRGRGRALLAPLAIVVGLAVLLALVGGLLAPPLLPLLFGPDFQVDPPLAAAITGASVGLGIITVTGAAALAAERHTLSLVGWVAAVLGVVTLLVISPLPLEWRCVVALGLGPLVGAAIHVAAMLSVGRVPTAS